MGLKKRARVLLLGMGVGLALLAFRCGGGGSPPPAATPPPPPPPPPAALTLSSLDPIVAMQKSAAFTLTLNGTGFTASSQATFNGSTKATTFVGSAQLTVQITAIDISAPGTLPVMVQSGGKSTASLNFYVVPAITQNPVTVSASTTTPSINISVLSLASPSLSLVAVGTGSSAGGSGVSVARGGTANLFIVGKGIVAGTFYLISGNSNDVTVTQPLANAFSRTTDKPPIPAVNVKISVSPSAATGSRDILVTNPTGEITAFVGGLLITP